MLNIYNKVVVLIQISNYFLSLELLYIKEDNGIIFHFFLCSGYVMCKRSIQVILLTLQGLSMGSGRHQKMLGINFLESENKCVCVDFKEHFLSICIVCTFHMQGISILQKICNINLINAWHNQNTFSYITAGIKVHGACTHTQLVLHQHQGDHI